MYKSLKNLGKLIKRNKRASPILEEILLIAIAIVIFAIIFSIILNLVDWSSTTIDNFFG